MKIVILAAGEGMRMRPLTLITPKPLVKVLGKPVLDHIFDTLPPEVNEAIIVVRYLGHEIKKYCGQEFYGRKIIYTEGSHEGSALSFLSAKEHLHKEKRFLLIQGDELPHKKDVERCLEFETSSLCFEVPDPWNHGVATLNADGFLEEIIEKPQNPTTCLISNGVMVLTNTIFECVPEKGTKKEFFFSSMFNQYIKKEKVKAIHTVHGAGGFSTPEDVQKIEQLILKRPA